MVKFLTGNKIYLRGLTKDDCTDQYVSFVNDVEALSLIEGIGYMPVDKEDLEEYIESCNNSENLLLGIFENKTDLHVGNIHLGQIKPYHHSCSYGIVLHRDHIKKGYAYEASSLLIKHAFEIMNIHRIQINVIEKNTRAIKLYEGLGAFKEGRLREAFYFQNKYYDIIVYSLLKRDYFKIKKRRSGQTLRPKVET